MSKQRLRFVADQCPLPWSTTPSLQHTDWYADSHNLPGTYVKHSDGYTVTVFKTRWLSWYRSFSVNPPASPESTALITMHEWLPKYQPAKTPGWHKFGRIYTWAGVNLTPDYIRSWSQHAKRHLKTFQKAGCQIRLGTQADVERLYQVSQVPKNMQPIMLKVLERHLEVHPDTISIFVAEKDGLPIGCFVAGDCVDSKLSEYILGAFHPEYTKYQPMVGLVDHWFQHSLRKNLTTLTFGHIDASPSRLSSGYGYSIFKTNFGVIRYWLPINHWRVYTTLKLPFSNTRKKDKLSK